MDQNETPERGSARTLAIIAIIVALTAPFWEGPLLGTINIRLPMATELAENSQALDRLERRTGDLEKQLNATTGQLSKLQTQLNEAAARANLAADRTATLAMVELAAALRRPGGFDLELATLRGVMPDLGDMKPFLDKIEPYAVTGIPSSANLRNEFSRISTHLQWSDKGYLSIAWVTRLLPPWQRSANATPAVDTTPQTLNQAVAQIASGDLAGAVASVQAISGSAQTVLADWLEDAKARVAADTLLLRLGEQITKRAGSKSVAQQKPEKA